MATAISGTNIELANFIAEKIRANTEAAASHILKELTEANNGDRT